MKKKKSGGGASWMDTYGDMVTLLLCFFVLLYSMSTISEENWKAIVMSFNPDAVEETRATSGNNGPNADPSQEEATTGTGMTQAEVDQDIEELYQALKEYVSQSGSQSNISVTKGDGYVFISFNQAVFFDGDSYALREESKPILDSVSRMLSDAADSIDEVRVLGHTAQELPDRPNNAQADRTISSMRASNVVVYIQEHSTLDPARLVSVGYGQWRPVGDNNTSEGRSQNRRVELIVTGLDLDSALGDSIQQYNTQRTGGDMTTGDDAGAGTEPAASPVPEAEA